MFLTIKLKEIIFLWFLKWPLSSDLQYLLINPITLRIFSHWKNTQVYLFSFVVPIYPHFLTTFSSWRRYDLSGRIMSTLTFFILSSLDLSELEAFEGLYKCFLQLLAKHVFFHRAKNSDYLLIFAEILFLYFSAIIQSLQFSSVTQLTLTLCDPMNHSTPGYLVHHQLPEFTQTHVHWVGDTIQPSHPLSSPSPPATNPSQHQGLLGAALGITDKMEAWPQPPLLIPQAWSQDKGVRSCDSDLFFPFLGWVGWEEC